MWENNYIVFIENWLNLVLSEIWINELQDNLYNLLLKKKVEIIIKWQDIYLYPYWTLNS